MNAVDTNVLVRFLTRDDEKQFLPAYRIFAEEERLFIPDTVVLETEWVLRYTYDYPADRISAVFTALFGLPNIRLANPEVMAQAVQWHREGLDFADALHLAQCQGSPKFYTFDRTFVAKSEKRGSCRATVPRELDG